MKGSGFRDRTKLFLAVLLGLMIAFTSSNLLSVSSESKEGNEFDAWQREWSIEWNNYTGTPHRIFGVSIKLEETLNEKNAEFVVRNFLSEHSELLGIDVSNLRLRSIMHDQPLYERGKGFWYVKFYQEYEGLKVVKSSVSVFINNGRIVWFGSDYYDIELNIKPSLSQERALKIAGEFLNADYPLKAEAINLVIFPVEHSGSFSPHLAWEIKLPFIEPLNGAWLLYVDARSGDVLYSENRLFSDSLTGYVEGEMYPEYPSQGAQVVPWCNETISVYQDFNTVYYSGYADSLNSYLVSNVTIDLNNATTANLTYNMWYDIEYGWDFLYIQISLDGSNWTEINGSYMTTYRNPNAYVGVEGAYAYTGSSGDWLSDYINLTEWVNNTVMLRFWYVTDWYVLGEGFYVDNISIIRDGAVLYFDDAEHGEGNWSLQGFSLDVMPVNLLSENVTGSDGFYAIENLTANITLWAELKGPYVDVNNADRDDAVHIFNITVPANHSWNWNASDLSYKGEESNVFYHVNIVHDYFTKGSPFNITEMNYQMKATVEYGSGYGNAFADGTNIFFYGPGGGIESTALGADVIYHEYTHNVVDKIYDWLPYTGETGAMNEGWADYFACTITNSSLIGDGIWPSPIRNLNNTLRYPDDWYGEVHYDSRMISGAMWDLRSYLGADLADSLIIRAMKLEGHSFTEFLDALITVDDDNGNILDGTPHIREIWRAFYTNHGIYSNYYFNQHTLPGWNFVSLPLVMDNTSIENVLRNIEGNYYIVWYYNASDAGDPWKKYEPSGQPWANDLTSINNTMAFWILMSADDDLFINGTLPSATDILLVEGWNFVGYPSLLRKTPQEALASIDGNYSVVWSYYANDTSDPWKKYSPQESPWANDLDYFIPGYGGYWIYADNATTWIVS